MYVQGESLKAHAALHAGLINSPITRGDAMRLLVILAALGLSACATPAPKIYFWHPNATNDELHRDLANCRMRVAMLPSTPAPYADDPNDPGNTGHALANLGAALQDQKNRDAFFQDCMTAKGWQMVSG